jgi:ubiquinone biosynthesis protein Coq4
MKTIFSTALRQTLLKFVIETMAVLLYPLRRVFAVRSFPYTHAQLRNLRRGSLGYAVATHLDARNLRLLRGYESHDVKHLLFGYEMDALGEVRLQLFLFGARRRSLEGWGMLLFGLTLFPDYWAVWLADYERGRRLSGTDASLDFAYLLPLPLHQAQAEVGLPVPLF